MTVAAVFAGVCVAGCSGGDETVAEPDPADGLRVASFDFAESTVLAELYAQVVEATGTPVVRTGPVGPREIAFPALELDVIDLLPEYLGTALARQGATTRGLDVGAARDELDRLLAPLGLTALDPAPAEDTNVVVVTVETAVELGVSTISDLGPHAGGLRFGGPPECPDRPLCLVGLRETYGLEFAEFVSQASQRFTAEALRRGEVDVGLMFSTDPALTGLGLVILTDDRRLQPAENIVPVVRVDAVERWGSQVATAIDELSAALTTEEVRALNARLLIDDGVDVVVAEWLADHGLAAAAD